MARKVRFYRAASTDPDWWSSGDMPYSDVVKAVANIPDDSLRLERTVGADLACLDGKSDEEDHIVLAALAERGLGVTVNEGRDLFVIPLGKDQAQARVTHFVMWDNGVVGSLAIGAAPRHGALGRYLQDVAGIPLELHPLIRADTEEVLRDLDSIREVQLQLTDHQVAALAEHNAGLSDALRQLSQSFGSGTVTTVTIRPEDRDRRDEFWDAIKGWVRSVADSDNPRASFATLRLFLPRSEASDEIDILEDRLIYSVEVLIADADLQRSLSDARDAIVEAYNAHQEEILRALEATGG